MSYELIKIAEEELYGLKISHNNTFLDLISSMVHVSRPFQIFLDLIIAFMATT